MNETTRRDVVRIAALAGAAVLAGATVNETLAAEPKSNDAAADQAERQRVIACGMTEAEADCWILASKAAASFFALPALHEMDQHEVAHATHIVQQKLLSRPAYRRYKDLLKAQPK